MLNNKGFAVSTILYTLLIAFLLFLGATLAMFSSSNSIISNANNDLINGTKLTAVQVIEKYSPVDFDDYDSKNNTSVFYNNNQKKFNCSNDDGFKWYEKYLRNEKGKIIKELAKVPSDIIVKINSKYGVMYWPRDFTNNYKIIENNMIFETSDFYHNNIYVEFRCNNKLVSSCELTTPMQLYIYNGDLTEEVRINIGDICD